MESPGAWRAAIAIAVAVVLVAGGNRAAAQSAPLDGAAPAPAAPAVATDGVLPADGFVQLVNGVLVMQPTAPSVPQQPEQPESPANREPSATDKSFGGLTALLAAAERAGPLPSAAGAPSDTFLPNQQASPPVDLVSGLQQSNNVQTVNNQLRNPASFDPRVRAYRYGQIYTQVDGANWVPVRQDLDSPLSMFDPSVVQSLDVVPGPYSPIAGAGFAYLNATTAPTPRYDNYESHAYLGTTYYGNGDQLNATQRIYGGNSNWGFSILHATRDGNAYRAGNGVMIPAAYNNEDFFAQFGFNLDADRKLEFRYLRQDQTNTQYPGQFFQTNIAVTQGFNVNYLDQSLDGPWTRLISQGWYNIGRLGGATNPNEHVFDVVARVNTALEQEGVPDPNFSGTTNASTITTGGRLATVYGEDGDKQLTVGADARYTNQYVNENLQFTDSVLPPGDQQVLINTGLPRSYMVDPGIFTEYTVPMASWWTATAGLRVDWLYSNVTSPFPAAYPPNFDNNNLAQSNVLYSLFLTNKLELDEHWTGRWGLADAQRPPTLTERYADGEFLALIQDGLSRVIGKPNISIERAWQFDVSLACNYEKFRGKLSGFCSLIQNFSTFSVLSVQNPSGPLGAQLLFTQTTPFATLAGAEAYGERDLDKNWTSFGGLLYVDGRDQTLHAPLTQIYPLEGRAGLRLHDDEGGKRWGVEFFARMVHAQDRLGTLRIGPAEPFSGSGVLEQRTGGFTVANLRSYWNATNNLNFVIGINNVFDRSYLEHLSLRFAADTVPVGGAFPGIGVYSPGFTPYVGVNWTY